MSFAVIFMLVVFAMDQNPVASQMSSRFGEKYDEALEAIFSIAVRLEALLSESGIKTSKNFMVSPLSMAVAVGELMLGARGALREQLYELLVVDSSNMTRSESVRHVKDGSTAALVNYALHEQLGDLMQTLQRKGEVSTSYVLKTASILFTQSNLTVNSEFKRNILKYYGTQIKEVDFLNNPAEAEKIVNQWAQDNTKGRIKTILPGPVSPQTAAILANAVYFKGDWEIPFSSEVNRRGIFKTSANSAVNVTFMMGEFENYKYVASKRLNCRMVIIPYENNELSMNIILPNENHQQEFEINKFVANLKTVDILELIEEAKQRKVFMILPKMSLSNTINVLEPLRRYHKYKSSLLSRKVEENIKNTTNIIEKLDEKVDAFKNMSKLTDKYADGLDLGGISDDPRFQISSIYQQMTLSVNEKGTEAAAVAASAIDYILESVNFRVDRPFLFFIRHEATQASLFWGTIGDPTENHE